MKKTLSIEPARTYSKNQSIELLRFLFAFIVLNFHFFNISGIFTDEEAAKFWFHHGNLAVEFFFLVSGFLMAASAFRLIESREKDGLPLSIGENTVSFMKRKIKGVFLTVLLGWILAFTMYQCFAEDHSLKTVLSRLYASFYEVFMMRNAGFRVYSTFNASWYISAMMLTMFVCYPLILKFKKTYLYVIAPLVAILVLGYMNHSYSTLDNVTVHMGMVYKCQLRAIGEINLGVVLFAISRKLKTVRFTKFGICILSLLEIACYAHAIWYMSAVLTKTSDYVMLAILAVAVCISFSQRTFLGRLADAVPSKICTFLGKFSLPLYLSHCVLCRKIIPLLFQKFGLGFKLYLSGVAVIFAVSLFVMFLTQVIKKWALPFLKGLMVQKSE
ncbi:MAG: acyltransferase [Clostridia bacterium]|nr:acyltransferase [Clostridia bacterium]